MSESKADLAWYLSRERLIDEFGSRRPYSTQSHCYLLSAAVIDESPKKPISTGALQLLCELAKMTMTFRGLRITKAGKWNSLDLHG